MREIVKSESTEHDDGQHQRSDRRQTVGSDDLHLSYLISCNSD